MTSSGRRLPVTWPLVTLFVAFPLWWVLGVSAFIWVIVAVPALVALWWRQRALAPVAMLLWLMFISWILMSGLQLESSTSIAVFAYRLSLYICAGVLFIYVYNLPRSGLMDLKVLRILTIFWMVIVAGGYAGILLAGHTFVPPIFHLLPAGLRGKSFVQQLILPVFSQAQKFLGYPVPRPAAPFSYTNQWGGNIAVLTLVAFAAAAAAGKGLRRRVIIAVLAASLVPMVFSLNRGMFLSLGLGILYVTTRLAIRGRVRALAAILALATITVAIVALTPLGHLVLASFSGTHGHSNSTRLSLYEQAGTSANASPLFGYGAPKPLPGQVGVPPIGTQGQLWMVLYSSGYPAAVLFVAFYLAVLWQTRRARGTAGLWLHAVPLVALAQIAVYGWLPAELQVVMVAGALAYRRCWRPTAAARIHVSEVPERDGRGLMLAAAGASRDAAQPSGDGLPETIPRPLR